MNTEEGIKAIKVKADQFRKSEAKKGNTENILIKMEHIVTKVIKFEIDNAAGNLEEYPSFKTYKINEDDIDLTMFFNSAIDFSEKNEGYIMSLDDNMITLDYSKSNYYIAYKAFMRDTSKFTTQIFDNIGGTLKVNTIMSEFIKSYIKALEIEDVIIIEVIDG